MLIKKKPEVFPAPIFSEPGPGRIRIRIQIIKSNLPIYV
jgi:hypothetical protein